MAIDTFFVNPVTLIFPAETVDRYGNLEWDWSGATEVDLFGWVADMSSFEAMGDRDTVTTSKMIFLPPDTNVPTHIRARLDDDIVYEIDGRPKLGHTPTGPHHLEVVVKVFDEPTPAAS